MAETFTMTPQTLARAIANGSRRERRRAAALLDERGDIELGKGNLHGAQLLSEMAEAIRSSDAAVAEPAIDPKQLTADDRDPHRMDEPEVAPDELPPIRHRDDLDEGTALVQGGAHRRLVHGYNGAAGHLRD